MRFSKAQRIVVISYLAVIILAGLYVPWRYALHVTETRGVAAAGYSWLWAPVSDLPPWYNYNPKLNERAHFTVDYGRLGLELMAITVAAGIAWVLIALCGPVAEVKPADEEAAADASEQVTPSPEAEQAAPMFALARGIQESRLHLLLDLSSLDQAKRTTTLELVFESRPAALAAAPILQARQALEEVGNPATASVTGNCLTIHKTEELGGGPIYALLPSGHHRYRLLVPRMDVPIPMLSEKQSFKFTLVLPASLKILSAERAAAVQESTVTWDEKVPSCYVVSLESDQVDLPEDFVARKIEALKQQLQADSAPKRVAAARLFSQFGEHGKPVVPALKEALGAETDEGARRAIEQALWNLP